MKTISSRRSKAVAPVLATLLMIAVAVAMSVIIFMWSQGFLSQTSESVGSQQGAQNQAAQSSIAIESTTFSLNTTNPGTETIRVIVRNVGAVAVTLGSITVTGISSNTGFTGSLLATVSSGQITTSTITASDSSAWQPSPSPITGLNNIPKGGSAIIALTTSASRSQTDVKSGDVVTIKVTTDRGTFAQASYTVP